jgi:ABC-type branched-subunit amino acid transport system substrate-binding protein
MSASKRLALLIWLVAFGILTAWSNNAQSQPVFRIGVLDEVLGPVANGARLAVAQINENGGIQDSSGTNFRLELVVEPIEGDSTLIDPVSSLAQVDVVAVLGPETNELVLSSLPQLQSLRVPILTPADGDTIVASDSSGYLFRIRAAERWQGASLAEYIVSELDIQQILTVQLDRNSTASRVGFSIALGQLPNPPQERTILLDENNTINDLVQEAVSSNTPVVVTYGPPELASSFYAGLRNAGYVGIVAYNRALDSGFNDNVSFEELRGILGTTTWAFSSTNPISNAFLNDFVRAYGYVPGPIEAASFDGIYLLAEALSQPGELLTNLAGASGIEAVQGTFNPLEMTRGETIDNTAVYQLDALGGPDIIARYDGTVLMSTDVEQPGEIVDLPPTATPTPEGVFLTIESARQNVRTGPGLEYDVIGQLSQGETASVIGATTSFDWVVINYRGQNGWLATYLLDIIGDRSTVPVIAPPPTPTPPPATATPTPQPIPDIVITGAAPSELTLNTVNVVNVTVQNIGGANAGPFAVAATFPPDNVYTSFTFSNGLAAGASQTVPLSVTPTSATGNFSVVIVADLNNTVPEGPTGEANNSNFTYNFQVDRQLILINNTTLASGASLDLEGNVTPQFDIQYTGAGLNTTGTCTTTSYCIGLLSPGLNWDSAYYGAITNAGGVNTTFIPNAALTPGAIVGVLTAEGRRAVARVDAISPGVSITITYRVYVETTP